MGKWETLWQGRPKPALAKVQALPGNEVGQSSLAERIEQLAKTGLEEAGWPVARQVEICQTGDPVMAARVVSQPWCSEEAKLGFTRTAPKHIIGLWLANLKDGHQESEAVCRNLLAREVGLKVVAQSMHGNLRDRVWAAVEKGQGSDLDRWIAARMVWLRDTNEEQFKTWGLWMKKEAMTITVEARREGVRGDETLRAAIMSAVDILLRNRGITREGLIEIESYWGKILYEITLEVVKSKALNADDRARLWPQLLSQWKNIKEVQGRSIKGDYQGAIAGAIQRAIESEDPEVEKMVLEIKDEEMLLGVMERMGWTPGTEHLISPKWLGPFIAHEDKKIRERAIKVLGSVGKAKELHAATNPSKSESVGGR